jgi:hypothetical protein
MLARYRIELFLFQLLRHSALVLGGGIEVAGTGRGNKLDLVTHSAKPFLKTWAKLPVDRSFARLRTARPFPPGRATQPIHDRCLFCR